MSHAPTRRQVAFVAAALLLSPLLTLYATQAVWLQNLLTPFSWMASHLPASGLFWLLFFSLMLPLYGLTRRLFIAYLPGTGFCMTLAIISRYKMDINGAPLQLSDFTFVGNLGDIAGFASDMLAPTLTVVVSVIVCILWTVLLAVLEKWHPSGTVGFLAIALSLALLLSAAYPGTLQEAAMALDQTCQDQEDKAILDSLVLGLHHADASLAALVEYFSQVDRPVMLVFVGDHLPSLNLADGTPIYTRLGYSPTPEASDWDADTLENMLSTNYLIWTNYETQAISDHKESCTFLGLHMLQRASVPLNQYFTWLADHAANQMLLSRNRFFADENGVGSYTTTPEQAAMLETYTTMERNLLYNR